MDNKKSGGLKFSLDTILNPLANPKINQSDAVKIMECVFSFFRNLSKKLYALVFLGGRYCYCLLGSSCVGWGGLSQSLGLQMTFESPFPIIIFFACCSDIIVVVGCIFTKTKTNIKK